MRLSLIRRLFSERATLLSHPITWHPISTGSFRTFSLWVCVGSRRYTPCTGITAVFKQERRLFAGPGLYLSPWCPEMEDAKKALAKGDVQPLPEAGFEIRVNDRATRVEVLMASQPNLAPILYVSLPDDPEAFRGRQTPYDTPHVKRDTFLFALAAGRLLQDLAERVFIWAADWQCVPAMARFHAKHVTCLHLHNLYDEYLADTAWDLRYDGGGTFQNRSALKAGFATADVVATVSQGFAAGIRTELLHTAIFAPHLQDEAGRIDYVENANFVELSEDLRELRKEMLQDLGRRRQAAQGDQGSGARGTPAEISKRLGKKTLLVSMGRAASQKQHCVVVEAASRLLSEDPSIPAFWVFATTNGDRDDAVRQDVIAAFCARHPKNAIAYSGRIPFFGNLMLAADLNVMASLWEPFGGAFEGIVLPVGRAVDGLASQIPAYEPINEAAAASAHWNGGKAPTGWLFREPQQPSAFDDLRSLLSSAVPSIHNATYTAMTEACSEAIRNAVAVHQKQPKKFAELVRNALDLQHKRSWRNYDKMLALAAEARARRGTPHR